MWRRAASRGGLAAAALLLSAAAVSRAQILPGSDCGYSETLTGRDIIARGVVERSAECLDSFLKARTLFLNVFELLMIYLFMENHSFRN